MITSLYVEKGEIAGPLKDAMLAGNIHDDLRRVEAVEDGAHPLEDGPWGVRAPALLIDGVPVTAP